MIRETLRGIEPPYSFSNRINAARTQEGLQKESLVLGQLERTRLHKISQVLMHPELDALIEEGKITLAVIKPNAHQGRNLPQNDEEAAAKLREEIGEDNIVFSFSTKLTEDQVDAFYGGQKERLSGVEKAPGVSVWDALSRFSRSGPLTFLLIYREQGDAVEWWRQKMGKTRPSEADPNSIRGRYALQENLPNNLTHGSDSVESVRQEVGHLRNIVSEIEEKAAAADRTHLKETNLQELGIIAADEELIQMQRIFDSGMRSESWIYGYKILVADPEGEVYAKYIREKHNISLGGDITYKTQRQVARFAHLDSIGVPIPTIYGARKAALYTDYIVNDQTEVAFRSLEKGDFDAAAKAKLDQLISIATKIDGAGYQNIGFLSDLIYDGDTNRFLFIDTGGDLGEARPGVNTHNCIDALKRRFGKYEAYIVSRSRSQI